MTAWEAEPLFELVPDFSGAWSARPITAETGCEWVARWHYSGGVNYGGTWFYGAFAPDMVCMVSLRVSPSNRHGVGRKLGLAAWPGNIEITRVVAHPEAKKNTASRAIALVGRYAHRERGLDWLFSYADTGQGHHGGIYQALNCVYVGLSPARPGFLLDGKPIHPRSVVARYGTQGATVYDLARAHGEYLERVDAMSMPKHLYVLPIAGPARNREIRAALAPLALAYPKRAEQRVGSIA